MYGMNNNTSQRRPAPYPNPMYMQSKRLQQPSSFPSSGMPGMNMSGTSGVPGNLPGNGFPGGMRGGMGGQFPPSGHSVGNSGSSCPPGGVTGAPNTSVSGGDMCCGTGQSQGPNNAQHLSTGMGSQMTNFQGCSSNGMTGSRSGGVQGNNFMSNGGFHNEYMGSHGQVSWVHDSS